MAARSSGKGTEVKMDLHVLITKEDGIFNATCLEMGLAAAGPDLKTVERDMMELIAGHLMACQEEGRPEDIFVPAPSEYWRKYFEAVREGACRPQRSLPRPEPQPAIKDVMSHLAVRSFVCA